MLKSLLIFLLVVYTFNVFCQEESSSQNTEEIFTFVDEEAEYPGGLDRMAQYISRNFRYPTRAIEEGIEGRIFVLFVIDKRGKVTKANIERGLPECPECEEEALRIIRGMPKWKPARKNGRKVNCYFRLPLNFALE